MHQTFRMIFRSILSRYGFLKNYLNSTKFVVVFLCFSYYNTLKVTAAFKRFPAVLPSGDVDVDYGLELAVRRWRTKSLMDEKQLRRKIVSNL